MKCEYGCGQEATYQFKNGKWCCSTDFKKCSNMRKKYSREKSKEELEKIGSKNAGKIVSKVTRERLKRNCSFSRKTVKEKIFQKEIQSRPEVKEKKSKSMKQFWDRMGIERKGRFRERMIAGGAVHANSFVKNPSWPQISIFRMSFLLLPSPILNYPIYTGKQRRDYSLDIADSKLGINIEYDGFQWHKDKKKDEKRDEELKTQGWKILRYRDIVPSLQQLRNDINRILGD